MASPPDGAPEPHTHAASDVSNNGDERPPAVVQVEASQYLEFSQSFFVPTKTGEEEAVCETQYNDERP
ncbi:hypothetical protein LTR53_019127, partial [Teratosphaeriaceae sp. CCFEE 6253]